MPDSPDRFDDPDAPPSPEELAAAEKLRANLEDIARPANADLARDDASLARALAASWAPKDLTVEQHRRIVQEALARGSAGRRGRVVRVSFGASALLAIAASLLLVFWSDRRPPGPPNGAPLAVSRSTQALFPDRFAPSGGETNRIDRIAMARAADLRDNEFAKWGVR